ncbi:MAG: carbon monoxide dehydrogenase subunit G [Thermomicrobiales bacterium]|jgi:carbon monoxide dehydrogenase subunit G|nr:carbon monoxide dehydrogenase subunit G [Thermomicrobiales bacterium]
MELVGEHTFDAPRQQVYDFLLDPEVLRQCLPGCEKLDRIGDDEYAATMKIGIAMIKGTFSGRVKISDKVGPESFTMEVEGSGPQGQVSGVGKLTLTEADGKTTVHYTGDANVRGTIARVGARMIQPAARQIVGQFFGCLAGKAGGAS